MDKVLLTKKETARDGGDNDGDAGDRGTRSMLPRFALIPSSMVGKETMITKF